MAAGHLVNYLEASASRRPDAVAVVDPTGRHLTYRELDDRSTALGRFLAERGVSGGDRVGVVLPKSAEAIITLFAIMKAGAAYVPVDFTAPAERGRRILEDCQVRAVVIGTGSLDVIPATATPLAATIVVGTHQPSLPAAAVSFEQAQPTASAPALPSARANSDLAYILYTSGSTGIPKGVMLTHENATSFVDWCTEAFAPKETDRFGNHAPFHFDLSVLDIYLAIKHGATLYLVSEELGKNPKELAKFIAHERLTIWYSTPSILTLLLQFGNLAQLDVSPLRIVFFAGEVFPVKHLRALKAQWPGPVYYNLYGPTETNVCTFARIPDVIPPDRETPYPIGFACAHCEPLVLDDELRVVNEGDEGLLYIAGPSVFRGYWNRPKENAAAFVERDGRRYYNTGDLVQWEPGQGYIYKGRKDRMVKRRGYRIELGEIERALYLHPQLREAAVIAVPDADAGTRIIAFLAAHTAPAPSIVSLKTFCAQKLPAYMSPDRFVVQDSLPRTSTDKVDYQSLKRMAAESAGI